MVKNIAMYLRLSVDEKYINESESILNQRMYLSDYINKDDELKNKPLLEFKDDGYSGTNDKRPGFQDLIEHMKQGKVDTIIVKDLSRFSRDYILLGDYLENIFPFMQIRFIAVNDRYDSREQINGIGMDIQFKTLLYDFYSKDCSAKIKSVQNSQKRQGKYLGWHPPYGYKKDPNDRHKIVVDPESANVVKKIFELYIEGLSCVKISRKLNEWNIKTPSERKEEITNMPYAHNVVRVKKNTRLWSNATISRILSNEFYTGTYVFNKTGNKVVGAKNSSNKSKDQWERVYDNHQVIIEKELFDKVQELKRNNTPQYFIGRAKKSKYRRSPLQSIVRCSECNSTFIAMNQISSSGRKFQYFWCTHCRGKNQKFATLRVDKYEEKVYQSLVGTIGEENLQPIVQENKENDKKINYQKEIKKIEKKIEKLDLKKRDSFDDYKSGEITRDDFINTKEDIEIQKLNLLSVKDKYEQHLHDSEEPKEIVKSNEKLTSEIVSRYINDIFIDREGNMEINYKE